MGRYADVQTCLGAIAKGFGRRRPAGKCANELRESKVGSYL